MPTRKGRDNLYLCLARRYRAAQADPGHLNAILKALADTHSHAGYALYQRFCRDAVDGRHLLVGGRVMQTSKSMAVFLYKRTEYEIWKLKFYYSG